MTIPNWASSACNSFFKTGDIQGAQRRPLSSEVAELLKEQAGEAFDLFQAADEGPTDLAKQKPGYVQLREDGQLVDVLFSGDKQAGELTQLVQEFPGSDQGWAMFSQVSVNKDEVRIFHAANESNQRTVEGQVINLHHPELSYNIATGSL